MVERRQDAMIGSRRPPQGFVLRQVHGASIVRPMNVVFLSPHFPPNMWLYVRRLREAGATVLGVADAPYDALRQELRDHLAEYYRVDDLHSMDQLRAAISHFVAKHGPINRLESLNEYWL